MASAQDRFQGIAYVSGRASGEVVASDLELSFWGGVDPATSEVIDHHHPLKGQFLSGKILVIPGGRGSCSGSGVLLELILNGCGPSGMIFSREEDILTLGVIVAEELFGYSIPVVTLDPQDFEQVSNTRFVDIDDGKVTCANISGKSSGQMSPQPRANHAFGEVMLTDRDKALLSGVHGEASKSAMRILTRMAQLQGARELVDVAQVHVDGCIYTGPASLLFAEKLRDMGGRVAVPTTLNSISVDHARWRAQGIDPSFGEPAAKLGDAYTDMGAMPSFTCAPYLLDTAPRLGEQIAWAESNAVVFGNSVLGARTMKYPDFLDICIALTGRAPLAGPHVDSNRKASVRIEIYDLADVDDSFFPLLGYWTGAVAGDRIPLIVGLEKIMPSFDDLKAFGAGFATMSSAPMFHISGVTPEAKQLGNLICQSPTIDTIHLRPTDLGSVFSDLNSAADSSVDLVSLGNPHFSYNEIARFSEICHRLAQNFNIPVVITTARSTYARAEKAGLVSDLEGFGVQFATDTCWCMMTEPVIPPASKSIMTNSSKYAHYGPGLTDRQFHFGSLAACAEAAVLGRVSGSIPDWMKQEAKP